MKCWPAEGTRAANCDIASIYELGKGSWRWRSKARADQLWQHHQEVQAHSRLLREGVRLYALTPKPTCATSPRRHQAQDYLRHPDEGSTTADLAAVTASFALARPTLAMDLLGAGA